MQEKLWYWCKFYDFGHGIGVKAYHTQKTAWLAYHNQRYLALNGISPEVYSDVFPVEFENYTEEYTTTRYAYCTEVIDVGYRCHYVEKYQEEEEKLKLELRTLFDANDDPEFTYHCFDIHHGNVGSLKNGKLVILDHGRHLLHGKRNSKRLYDQQIVRIANEKKYKEWEDNQDVKLSNSFHWQKIFCHRATT